MSKKTPLHDIHVELGASFTDFAGWSMPLRYSSELAEHHAVRNAAGIFDLTHMGEIEVAGREAARALDHALVGQPSKISVGRARYSMLVHETGGVLDDLVVYRLEQAKYLVVANAGNAQIVCATLRDRIDGFTATIQDASNDWALIAVQGPNSASILAELVDVEIPSLKHYAIDPARLSGREVLLARTGYTGEDGFEIYARPEDAPAIWRAVRAAGDGLGLVPCGLACRDTLRLEAGMPLYRPGTDRVHHPVRRGARPGRGVREARRVRRRGRPVRPALGLTTAGRRAPRTGYPVLDPGTGQRIGEITSGALSPTRGHPVAMAYLPPDWSEPGTKVLVDIRGMRTEATVVALPFYRRHA